MGDRRRWERPNVKTNRYLFASAIQPVWRHVASREIYSNPEIAILMNQWFINIKIDREERPDLDRIYMLATQLTTGHGGWPNNVFLTPELKPFFAGSYFPPDDQSGRPGFKQILTQLHDAWTHVTTAAISETSKPDKGRI